MEIDRRALPLIVGWLGEVGRRAAGRPWRARTDRAQGRERTRPSRRSPAYRVHQRLAQRVQPVAMLLQARTVNNSVRAAGRLRWGRGLLWPLLLELVGLLLWSVLLLAEEVADLGE
jgi:hypothetical protein